MKIIYTLSLALLSLVTFPALALADEVPNPRPGLVLDSTQTYTLLIGSLVPLVTYVLNHYAPWCDEKIKATVLVIVAAVSGGLYQALSAGGLALDAPTVQIVGTSVIAALFAHRLLWQPSGISTKLGGGSNATKNTQPAAP